MSSAPQSASSNFRKLLSQLEQEHDREIVMLEQTIAAALGSSASVSPFGTDTHGTSVYGESASSAHFQAREQYEDDQYKSYATQDGDDTASKEDHYRSVHSYGSQEGNVMATNVPSPSPSHRLSQTSTQHSILSHAGFNHSSSSLDSNISVG